MAWVAKDEDMARLEANGITIECEREGDARAPAMLLICGLGAQLIYWGNEFIERLLAGGFQVVRFDNRDAGRSQKLVTADGGTPYTLCDMAADAVGVLDALGIARAHVVGRSMGGIVAQPLAAEHGERVISLTLLMSTGHAPGLPPPDPRAQALMLGGAGEGADRDQVLDHLLAGDYAWASPKYPFDEATKRAENARAFDRCYCPDGLARQYAAIAASGPRLAWLQRIGAPTLVVHGTHDTLLPPAHGRDLAKRIAGAELMEIDGMGHNLDGDLGRVVADAIVAHARKAQRRKSGFETERSSALGDAARGPT